MNSVLDNVRKALGRTHTPTAVPMPPAIPDTVARLVHSPIGLPDLFNKRAAEMKMLVSSLVPFVHVAVVEPKNFLPDLLDMFETLARDGVGSGVTMISGPSKTADIEMNVVTGVHGPNVVKAFVLE